MSKRKVTVTLKKGNMKPKNRSVPEAASYDMGHQSTSLELGCPSWQSTVVGFFLLLFFLPCGSAFARDLEGRLGLGFNSEFANFSATNGVPAISLKYGLSRDTAVEGVVGIATGSPGNSVTGGKFFKNLFFETNLNFYFMAGAAILTGDHNKGSEFLGGFGCEFFIPGLESLGFSMETGGTFDNLSGSFVLKTLGVSFLNAGMHFYL